MKNNKKLRTDSPESVHLLRMDSSKDHHRRRRKKNQTESLSSSSLPEAEATRSGLLFHIGLFGGHGVSGRLSAHSAAAACRWPTRHAWPRMKAPSQSGLFRVTADSSGLPGTNAVVSSWFLLNGVLDHNRPPAPLPTPDKKGK